jgi:hypothetical protein
MSDEQKLSERFEAAAKALPTNNVRRVPEAGGRGESVLSQNDDKANAVLGMYMWPRAAEILALCLTERDRILEALRLDEDPRRAIADRLLAICEEPNTEQRYSIGAAAWNDHNDGEAAGEAACAALLALAKGTAP